MNSNCPGGPGEKYCLHEAEIDDSGRYPSTMNNDTKTPHRRRLVDRVGDAVRDADKSGRQEFAASLEAIRDSVIEAELAEGFGPRPNDEFREWLDRRYGKDNKLIRTPTLTA
jgi:hypothetical protein